MHSVPSQDGRFVSYISGSDACWRHEDGDQEAGGRSQQACGADERVHVRNLVPKQPGEHGAAAPAKKPCHHRHSSECETAREEAAKCVQEVVTGKEVQRGECQRWFCTCRMLGRTPECTATGVPETPWFLSGKSASRKPSLRDWRSRPLFPV